MRGKPGGGLAGNIFPRNHEVQFKLENHNGESLQSLTWDYGDNTSHVSGGNERITRHKYQSVGHYNFTLTAVDMFGAFSVVMPIVIKQSFGDLRISDNSPRVVNASVTFVIAFKQFDGSPAAVKVLLGDGHRLAFVTADKKADMRAEWPSAEIIVVGQSASNVTFTHAYSQVGQYVVKVTGVNEISERVVTHRVFILREPCRFPDVHFVNAASSAMRAVNLSISRESIIYTRISVKCQGSRETIFKWQIFLDTSPESNGTLLNIPTDVARPYLVIPAFSLPYGLLRLRFKVKMDGVDWIETYVDGFINVVPSKLKAGILGGNVRSEGLTKSVLIDGSISRDKDVAPGNFTGIEFIWLCRRINESLPPDAVTMHPVARAAKNDSDLGGCYGDGPGRLNYSTPKFLLDTGKMIKFERYVITLVIKKGKRNSSFSQTLHVLPGNPLSVFVR